MTATLPPPPINTNGMTVGQAQGLVPGANVVYRDMIALIDYHATVTQVVPNVTLTINVPTLGETLTFDIDLDGTIILPLFILE
jgi:hypothetical protein